MKTAGVPGAGSAPRFLFLRGILLCTFPALELCHTTHMLYSIGYLLTRRQARVCLKHGKKLKTSVVLGEFVRHVSGASNWKVSLQENTL